MGNRTLKTSTSVKRREYRGFSFMQVKLKRCKFIIKMAVKDKSLCQSDEQGNGQNVFKNL